MDLRKTLTIFTESTLALAVVYSSYSIFILRDFDVIGENHLLEILQALTLLAVLAVYMWSVFQSHRSDRLLCLFFVWLTVTFFLRELSMDGLNPPDFIVKWGSGSGRNMLLAASLLAITILVFIRLGFYFDLAKVFLKSESGIMTLKSGVLLILGDICEKAMFANNVFFEEVFELIAYAVLLRAATLLAYKPIYTGQASL